MEPEFRPDAIVAVLVQQGVDFVVIGGTAAYLYGSNLLTEDIDVVPEAAPDNLTRLSRALTELDARIRLPGEDPVPFGHDATSLASATFWNLTTKHGDLDISFTPSGTTGYADLVRDAVSVTLGGTPVRLASLADIIRSKAAAGRDKDNRALPVLRELLSQQLKRDRP